MVNYNTIWVCREKLEHPILSSRVMLCWKVAPIWDNDLQVWLKADEGEMITLPENEFPDIKVGECREFKI